MNQNNYTQEEILAIAMFIGGLGSLVSAPGMKAQSKSAHD